MTEHDLTNESHREICAECTATWAELDAISAEAQKLPTLTPSRDLWAGIEARLGGESESTQRWFKAPVIRYAAAAAVLIVATATVTWRIANERPLPLVADGLSNDSTGDLLVRVAAAGYEEDFVNLGREIEMLQALLDQRRHQLDSATVEIVERNLKLIDTAIAESRAAFLRDPASQFLASQLARSYATKLTLLRATATMPMGT